jgi:hypothetical protein
VRTGGLSSTSSAALARPPGPSMRSLQWAEFCIFFGFYFVLEPAES